MKYGAAFLLIGLTSCASALMRDLDKQKQMVSKAYDLLYEPNVVCTSGICILTKEDYTEEVFGNASTLPEEEFRRRSEPLTKRYVYADLDTLCETLCTNGTCIVKDEDGATAAPLFAYLHNVKLKQRVQEKLREIDRMYQNEADRVSNAHAAFWSAFSGAYATGHMVGQDLNGGPSPAASYKAPSPDPKPLTYRCHTTTSFAGAKDTVCEPSPY